MDSGSRADSPSALDGAGPILMLDDDLLDIRLARWSHARSGIARPLKVFTSADALFAHLDLIVRGHNELPALILLDVRMPCMDGFAVLRAIRSREELAEVPIAMLTTSTLRADRERAIELGCSAYLTKPSTRKDLIGLFQVMGP